MGSLPPSFLLPSLKIGEWHPSPHPCPAGGCGDKPATPLVQGVIRSTELECIGSYIHFSPVDCVELKAKGHSWGCNLVLGGEQELCNPSVVFIINLPTPQEATHSHKTKRVVFFVLGVAEREVWKGVVGGSWVTRSDNIMKSPQGTLVCALGGGYVLPEGITDKKVADCEDVDFLAA